MVDESLGFFTEYFSLYAHTKRRIWDLDQEVKDTCELLQGKAKYRVLTRIQMNQIHEYVASHSIYTAELLRYITFNFQIMESSNMLPNVSLQWGAQYITKLLLSYESREYDLQKAARVLERAQFREHIRQGRARTPNTALHDHLCRPFPKFTQWLNVHVVRLHHDNFPIPTTVVSFST
jgi:hypothetical protein